MRRIVLGAREHRSGVASQKQNLRCLDRLIGVFPVPGSLRVARADGAFHGGAQGRGVDDLPFGEMDDERLRAAIPSAHSKALFLLWGQSTTQVSSILNACAESGSLMGRAESSPAKPA
ncbi:MAG: hypothetical protein WA156_18095 [Methylocystis silviterrae]